MALKAGPKGEVTVALPPFDPSTQTYADWFEDASGLKLYKWQYDEVNVLAAGQRPRVAYFQVGRKNGKSLLGAALAIIEMCLKQERHVYVISDSERNLNSVLMREIRNIIIRSDKLRPCIHIFKNHIEVPQTMSFLETRPSKYEATQGINPHLVIFDEVHLQKSDETWNGAVMAGAARPDFLLLGITTPGYDVTSMAHGFYQAVKAGSETIYGRVFEPDDPECKLDDEEAWKQANPAYEEEGSNLHGALAFAVENMPEHEFRRFHLGLWTAGAVAWLPYGAWDARIATVEARTVAPGTRVWLAFDGSYSGDSTALVGCTEHGYVFVVACWENPGTPGYRVPRDEVEDAVELAMAKYNVVELLCDPPYWAREIADWTRKWPKKVVEFPTHVRARMAPACTALYSGVMDGTLTHDGDKRLARHVGNAIVKASPQGDYITKVEQMSAAKIDLAVAAVIAYSRAVTTTKKRKSPVAGG